MDVDTIILNGVWPTMITPYTADNKIDFDGLRSLIEWYLANKVHGVFAVCQSSEMQYLTLKERVELASFVVKEVNGRVPVACSGHVSSQMKEQTDELKAMADTGVDILVLVTNRLAGPDESDDVWKQNLEIILDKISNISLGLYECPKPYNRLIEPETLQWCCKTNRFAFFKDTSCDLKAIQGKINAVRGTSLKIFNANAATLLPSLRMGVSGYCGVMANFHPSLYVWLVKNWAHEPKRAEGLQDFLGLASVIEQQCYPINAKYHCQLENLPISLNSRSRELSEWKPSYKIEVEQLRALTQSYLDKFKL